MNQSSSKDLAFAIVLRGDTVCTLPDEGCREQPDHANDGKDDVCLRPDHLQSVGFALHMASMRLSCWACIQSDSDNPRLAATSRNEKMSTILMRQLVG